MSISKVSAITIFMLSTNNYRIYDISYDIIRLLSIEIPK